MLKILKPGGRYFLIDMHEPIANQPGEWPLLFKWCRFPRLEGMAYFQTTVPLALNRLWAWRDTTFDFYTLPLVVWRDAEGNNWGFKVISFEVESQRWWLGLPLMPIGKIVVEKTHINEQEFNTRKKIVSFVRAHLDSMGDPRPKWN